MTVKTNVGLFLYRIVSYFSCVARYSLTYVLLVIASVSAQDNASNRLFLDLAPDTLFVMPDTTIPDTITLPHQFIIPGSERLYAGSFRLRLNNHYRIAADSGKIYILQSFAVKDSLQIIYKYYPFPLYNEYFHRELIEIKPQEGDSLDKSEVAREKRAAFLEELDTYQYKLQKRGSILRGVEIGTNRDLALNSGLNLQLAGKISEQVELVAALTDESTPIQPEGNTQSLREVDKVFVSITSPYLGGTIGDFNLLRSGSEFGNLQRKLQGVTINGTVAATEQRLTFGTSRGFFHSNRFLAQEGNQGPYPLTGRNGEREIIILAGTERVYVDGVLQVRGENNDYIIDYSLAQLSFTSRRLITSENRIEIDFEYSSAVQRYGRTFLEAGSSARNMGGRVSYDLRVFREWDDTGNLLEDDAPLTDAEEAALAIAGDNPLAATVDGSRLADTTKGETGNYNRQPIVLPGGEADTIFVYAGPDQGAYRVLFSGVGAGNGDYSRTRLGVYEFAGRGQGQYLPVKLVPLAGDRRLLDARLNLRLTDAWHIDGEFAASDADLNVFSSTDDQNNRGNAFNVATTFNDTSLSLNDIPLGNLRVVSRWKNQEQNFEPLDRALAPEYGYKWNLEENQLNNQENSLELLSSYSPIKSLSLDAEFGSIDKGSDVSSSRSRLGLRVLHRYLPETALSVETVNSETPGNSSDWIRQSASVKRGFGRMTPAYKFRREDRRSTTGEITGFVFEENETDLKLSQFFGVDWNAGAKWRKDFLYDPLLKGGKREQATTQTLSLQGNIIGGKAIMGSFAFSYRQKDFDTFFEQLPADSINRFNPDPQFQDTSWQDRESHLANIELQYRSGPVNSRLDYKVASELQGIREKVYLPVDDDRGNYIFDSTLNEYLPDPQGDFILILLQTGEFESVTRLEAGWQLQYRPELPSGPRRKQVPFWKRFSGLTYARLEEESKLNDILDLYLLNLDKFHSTSTSLRGSYVLNQDLHFDELNPDYGILLRSRYRDILSNQFLDASDNETRILWDRIIQVRRRFFRRKLNVTVEYANTLNKRWVASSPSRNRNILSQAYSGRLNFRPSIQWQLQLEVERGLETERNSNNALTVNFWELKPQVSFSLRGKSRSTATLTYLSVAEADNPFSRPIPFEMGKGKKFGESWLWDIRFEYFVSGNVTINANYNGRRDAEALRTIHLGKAEVRVFF